MPSPLSSLYSTIDSIKRVLADRISDPTGDLLRTLGRAAEDSAAFRETQKAGGTAAADAMLNTVLNFSPMGMIAPASRVLDFQTFNKANKSLNSGASASQVYKDTGAYKVPHDDVLRTVISDLNSKLKTTDLTSKNAPKTVGELLDHPELFAKFPELASISIKPTIGYRSAAYGAGDKSTGELPYIKLGSFTDPAELHVALLHELQHGVQDIGAMTPGGNPGQFISDPVRLNAARKAAASVYEPLDTAFDKALETAGLSFGSAASKQLPEYVPYKAALKDDLALFKAATQAPMDRYLALPGETEARLVESMFKAGKGVETFPPAFQQTIKDLTREDLSTTHYVDLEPTIAALIDKFAPRK